MLRLMRTGAQSWIIKFFLFGLLLLATVGLAAMDYRGMFSNGFKPTTVAEVGGEKITSTEFDQLLQGAMRRQRMKPVDAYRSGYPAVYLQNEINSRLLRNAVRDFGIVVSEEQAAKQVRDILRTFPQEGVTENEALQNLLYKLGVSERQLLENQKIDIALNLLMHALSVGITAPEQMATDALKYQAESRRGEYFTLTAADAAKSEKPSDDELKDYYKKISSRYMLPEYRSFAVLVIDPKTLVAIKDPTEADLLAHYEAHKDMFNLPETRSVSRLVVADAADAKAFYEEAKTAGDLKKIADAHKDKATFVKASSFGEADAPVEMTAAFKAEEGAVLEPAETALGWVISRVEKIVPPHAREFAEVKSEVAREIESERTNDNAEALYKRANEIDDMAAGGKNLADIAASLSLKETVIGKTTADGTGADGKKTDPGKLPVFDKILAAAFHQEQGVVGGRLEGHAGEMIMVEVSSIDLAQEQPFEKVQVDVLKAWQLEKNSAALDQLSAKILDRLKLGEDFDGVAKSLGKKAARTDMILRSDHAAAAKMANGMFPALFALEKAGQVTVVGGGESATILRLADRTIDEKRVPKPEDVKSIRTMLDNAVQKDLLEEFRLSLVAKYDVKIHEDVLKDMYKDKAEDDGQNSN